MILFAGRIQFERGEKARDLNWDCRFSLWIERLVGESVLPCGAHSSRYSIGSFLAARVAELADALDSGSSPRKGVQVQLLSRAPLVRVPAYPMRQIQERSQHQQIPY